MTRYIKFSEVKEHNNKDSVWMVIHNDVYDVTSFLEEHPGGEDTLLEVAGKDGTQPFEDVGHSMDARELLRKYKIGSLPPGERTHVSDGCTRPSLPKSSYKAPSVAKPERRVQSIVVPHESSNLKWAVIALASALIIGVALRKYLASA